MTLTRTLSGLLAALLATAAAAQETRKVSDAWTLDAIAYNAKLTADWMTANPKKHNHLDWTYGAFYAGITALGLSDPTLPYLEQVRTLGKTNGWGRLPRTYHADDHCIGQSWLEVAAFDNNPVCAEPLRACFDVILAHPATNSLDFTKKGNQNRWSWCDALFMSPTVLIKMYGFTGDTKYLAFMDQEYKATTDYLFDKEEHLYYRDSRFFERRTKNDKKVFWCRGNGWVFGSLPIILRDLPQDWPTRPFYLKVYKQMAAAIKKAQHADGAWRPSLLDLEDPDLPEMSGTSFFTFGLLWGINNGILDRAEYLPCVEKSWKVITRNINEAGRLGWVQPIGDRPVSYTADDYQVYAVGAYLCAAMELRKLVIADAHPARRVIDTANPLNVYRAAETIALDWAKLGLKADKLRVFDVRNSAVLPHQLIDNDGDGTPDQMLFKSYFLAQQQRQFWVFESDSVPAAPAVATCAGRYVPERMDDYAWENDRMAYRMYGPKLSQPAPAGEGLVSSGVDVWCKRVRHPVIDAWYTSGKYHADHGEGCDFYKVGTGRGCGGLGIFRDGACFVSGNWATQKTLATGPVRTVFELTYAPWPCGSGVTVAETRRVSLDAGSHLTRFESRFTVTGSASLMAGPGLDTAAKHQHNGTLASSPEQGWLANYEPAQKEKGCIATALVIPQAGTQATDTQECVYLLSPLAADKPFVWYAGAAWSNAGDFVKPDYWTAYVSSFAAALKAPISVTVK
jgi:rhamnogalacturonyl hydrolase YesR